MLIRKYTSIGVGSWLEALANILLNGSFNHKNQCKLVIKVIYLNCLNEAHKKILISAVVTGLTTVSKDLNMNVTVTETSNCIMCYTSAAVCVCFCFVPSVCPLSVVNSSIENFSAKSV